MSWGSAKYYYLKITPMPKLASENEVSLISTLILWNGKSTGIAVVEHTGSIPEHFYAFFQQKDADDFKIP